MGSRQLFVRAARLCPARARQCVGPNRPREADRHGGARASAKGRRAAGLIRHATPNAHLHRHLVTAARRQDADCTRADRIFSAPRAARSRPFDVNPDEFKLIDHLPAYTAAASLNDNPRRDRPVRSARAGGRGAEGGRSQSPAARPFLLGDAADRFHGRGAPPRHRADGTVRRRSPRAFAPGLRHAQGSVPDLPLVPVLNENVQRVGAYRGNFPPTRLGGEPISIPALSPVVRSWSTGKISRSSAMSRRPTTRRASSTNGWAACSSHFASCEVRLLLGKITPQLKHSA